MVQIGLWGLPSRGSAWAFFWLSMAIAVACVVAGFVLPLAFAGSLMIFAALWYYLSIRWVDENSDWGPTWDEEAEDDEADDVRPVDVRADVQQSPDPSAIRRGETPGAAKDSIRTGRGWKWGKRKE